MRKIMIFILFFGVIAFAAVGCKKKEEKASSWMMNKRESSPEKKSVEPDTSEIKKQMEPGPLEEENTGEEEIEEYDEEDAGEEE